MKVLPIAILLMAGVAQAQQQPPPPGETDQEKAERLSVEAWALYEVQYARRLFLAGALDEAYDRYHYIAGGGANNWVGWVNHPNLTQQQRNIINTELTAVLAFLNSALLDVNAAKFELNLAHDLYGDGVECLEEDPPDYRTAITKFEAVIAKVKRVRDTYLTRAENSILESHSRTVNGVPKGMDAIEDFLAMSLPGVYVYYPGYTPPPPPPGF